jgi:hypothetical protein
MLHFILYDQTILLAVGSIAIFMGTTPSIYLYIKYTYLVKQHKFILIQIVPLHVWCT